MSKTERTPKAQGMLEPSYKVGYGQPPKEHQFKRGQSGNPRGRPRKYAAEAQSVPWDISRGAVGRIAYESIPANLNGKQTAIPAIEALHRRRLHDALKGGNRLLQREIIAEANAHEQELLQLEMARYLKLQNLKAEGAALIAQAKAKGLPQPILLPHPDDIIIDEEALTATVDGPETKEQLAITAFILALRDHYVLRAVYQERFPPLLSPLPENNYDDLKASADGLNERLCTRLRWGRFGFLEAAKPLKRRGFRFMEADMHDSLARLRHMWTTEPALDLLHTHKGFVTRLDNLLGFKTRGHERRIWRKHEAMIRAIYREAYGDVVADRMPKCSPLRPFAERMVAIDAAPEEERAFMERQAKALIEAGLFRQLHFGS